MALKIDRYDIPRSEWERIIHEWIFNERHRAILCERLFDGYTYEELAERHGLSVQQIKTIVYRAMAKIEKHI